METETIADGRLREGDGDGSRGGEVFAKERQRIPGSCDLLDQSPSRFAMDDPTGLQRPLKQRRGDGEGDGPEEEQIEEIGDHSRESRLLE